MSCPVCSSKHQNIVIHRDAQACSAFWNGVEQLPRFEIDVTLCDDCQLVYYSSVYDRHDEFESVMSTVYGSYTLMERDSRRFPVERKTLAYALDFLLHHYKPEIPVNIFEVGSNRGDFLYHLKKELPLSNILGVEPSKLVFYGVPTLNRPFKDGLVTGTFDLIVTRHVMEHIIDPATFVRSIAAVLSPSGTLFIEVPNTLDDLKRFSEPFIVEHVNHFSPKALQILLQRAGLEICAVLDEPMTPLCVIARHNPSPSFQIKYEPADRALKNFASAIDQFVEKTRQYLENGTNLIFYGAGNIFLSVYGVLEQRLSLKKMKDHTIALIDDSPARIGRNFLGHTVAGIDTLLNLKNHDVYVILCTMNDIDRKKMAITIRDVLGVPEVKILKPWMDYAN